jgi:hypothetical protein
MTQLPCRAPSSSALSSPSSCLLNQALFDSVYKHWAPNFLSKPAVFLEFIIFSSYSKVYIPLRCILPQQFAVAALAQDSHTRVFMYVL